MTIETFQDKVMQIRPNNFMGLNGAAAGIVGSASSASDAVLQLQRAVIEFTRLYKTGDNEQYLLASRKEVLAKIMVARTFDAISEKMADELVLDLQKLMKERK